MVSISLGHSRAQARLPWLQLPMSTIAPLLCLGPPQPVARNASGRLGGPARSSPSRPCTNGKTRGGRSWFRHDRPHGGRGGCLGGVARPDGEVKVVFFLSKNLVTFGQPHA